MATSNYIRTEKILGTDILINSDNVTFDSENVLFNNNIQVDKTITASHINTTSINIASGVIHVNKIMSSNAIFTNDITVTGNLSVLGTQTILNSTIVEIDDIYYSKCRWRIIKRSRIKC